VDDVSLDVGIGEFVVLLGPSGCGKTTLLRCVAGLEQPDDGEILLGGTCVYSSERRVSVPPEKRSTSIVFQSYALWPHMTVFKNVAYPLRKRRLSGDEIAERVRAVLTMVGIAQLAGQHPGQLSGGQQQRVALARALVANNDVVLFDEPLSNVDAKVRDQLRVELLAMQRDLGFASLYVTHDQTEAMELGHRIATLRNGRIEHLAPPSEIYMRPATRYVANFVGRTNELVGVVEQHTEGRVRFSSVIGPVEGVAVRAPYTPGDAVVGVVRPEAVRLAEACEPDADNQWLGRVQTVLFSGAQVRIEVQVGDLTVEVWERSGGHLPAPGAQVWVSFPTDSCGTIPDEQAEVQEEGASERAELSPVAQ
jgi:iron(III) transport system ATP-binding protein